MIKHDEVKVFEPFSAFNVFIEYKFMVLKSHFNFTTFFKEKDSVNDSQMNSVFTKINLKYLCTYSNLKIHLLFPHYNLLSCSNP